MRRRHRTRGPLQAVFLLGSACGDDDATQQTATADAMSGELNELLPDDIREAGVIKAGGPVTEPRPCTWKRTQPPTPGT